MTKSGNRPRFIEEIKARIFWGAMRLIVVPYTICVAAKKLRRERRARASLPRPRSS